MNILIIEDEKPAARRLSRMLATLDIEVQEMLHSVEESLHWLQNNENPEQGDADWLNNSDTGANITEDEHPWE